MSTSTSSVSSLFVFARPLQATVHPRCYETVACLSVLSVCNIGVLLSSLFVRRTRLTTIGDRAFPVAAARVWNCLPQHVTSAPSLPTFRSCLKTHLFSRCYPAVKPEKWFLYSGRSCYCYCYCYCCQTVGWIKIPLGTEVGLGPGDIVLDWDSAPPPAERGTSARHFSALFALARSPISATAELLFLFYSAPQCSHCKRCISYCNSVRLSVCPSVRHTSVLCQNDGT